MFFRLYSPNILILDSVGPTHSRTIMAEIYGLKYSNLEFPHIILNSLYRLTSRIHH